MFFIKSKEKELTMIWQVEKNGKKSYLIGTAHYFPHSFKASLLEYIKSAGTVIFEGPLDPDSMAKVQAAGQTGQDNAPLFEQLDHQTIAAISQTLFPSCRQRNPYFLYNFKTFKSENPTYDMIKGMKPWLAFFTIWFSFLEKKGWKYSVDLEAYEVAKELRKKIIFLETIEEQIEILESLPHDRIIKFLKQTSHWGSYVKDYVKTYLAGDPENLKFIGREFPNRSPAVIDRRDQIFYERMAGYLKNGRVTVCIGAPHIRGVSQLLRSDGYQIDKPASV